MDELPADSIQVRDAITDAVVARADSLPGLIEAQYDNLLALARQIYSRERAGLSLSPTALVHEAFVRLVDQPRVTAEGTMFFRACFAQECRRVLVEHARRRNAQRRGGDRERESLSDRSAFGFEGDIDLIELGDAVEALARKNPRLARIADMRLFAEMSVEDCGEALGLSTRTVYNEWAFARSWLQKELS